MHTVDIPKRDALLAKVHEIVVEDAPWIFVAQPSIAARVLEGSDLS